MFRECPFCGTHHRSVYVDELEEMVLKCRETAERHRLGLLEDYAGHETSPTKCETEMLSRAVSETVEQERAA
jgi:hypothetical protein